MTSILRKIKTINNKFREDHLGEYAAECAYFTILSFIPFIIFFLTLIQFTSVDKENIYYFIRELVPLSMHDIILGVIDEVYSKSVGTISVAAILALWSASKGFYYLSKGLRTIYKTKCEKINIIVRIEGILYTLIFVIAIIVFLVIMVFGNRIYDMVSGKFEAFSLLISYILKIRFTILIIAMFFIFLMIYKVIPKHKLKLRTQIYGALFSSIAWYVASWCFSIYVNIFKGFSNTYGSLTSIILIMMWVYVCMYIILLGGEINYFVQEFKLKKLNDVKK